RKRCTFTGPPSPRMARFVDVSKGMNLVVLGADHVVAFTVDRAKAYEYTHTEPLLTLEVSGTTALVAGAHGALAWTSELDPTTAPPSSAAKFTVPGTITHAALTSYGDRWLALLAADSPGGAVRRVYPFDFSFVLPPFAWTTFDVDHLESLTPFS